MKTVLLALFLFASQIIAHADESRELAKRILDSIGYIDARLNMPWQQWQDFTAEQKAEFEQEDEDAFKSATDVRLPEVSPTSDQPPQSEPFGSNRNEAEMKDWERAHFEPGGGQPFLFYVLYGNFAELGPMRRSVYFSNGIPEGITLSHYDRDTYGETLDTFREGYLWDQLGKDHPALQKSVAGANECYVLKGEIEDQENLNYLRDAVGLIAYLADHGGIALYDPQMLKWWSIEGWKSKAFEHHEARPREHVVILVSEEDGGYWYHTRGLRKFGRPDLSIREIGTPEDAATIDLLNRFIEYQAFGGVIEEGQEIRVRGLPPGYRCYHRGDLDDPDFNNVHVEITNEDNR